jgi:hypothetical protein
LSGSYYKINYTFLGKPTKTPKAILGQGLKMPRVSAEAEAKGD